ncbi:hypothetical protein QE152_g29331 [Popillia japonica]|uniref:Uncharacterized protein n=1 Tax=Popillia japonica TaxID=7064 RepID=A0AAW1JJB0_POPJA
MSQRIGTTLAFTAITLLELEIREELRINVAENWYKTNKLELNAGKIQKIKLQTKPTHNQSQSVKMLGVYVEIKLQTKPTHNQSQSVKMLGVYVDSGLN